MQTASGQKKKIKGKEKQRRHKKKRKIERKEIIKKRPIPDPKSVF